MQTAQTKLKFVAVTSLLFLTLAFMPVRGSDYVFATDVSGSMSSPVPGKNGKSRVLIVQEALRNYLAALPASARITMIAFNDHFDERESILSKDADRGALTQWIDGFAAEVKQNRGTRLYDALRRALTVARNYAKENPHQYVEIHVLTDGEDSSGVPADRMIPEILREFPEVDGHSIRVNLVLAGDWSSAMIVRLEKQLRPLGVDVTDAGDFSQPILPPVILHVPDPIRVSDAALFADNSKTLFVGYEWWLNGSLTGKEKSLKATFDSPGPKTVELVGITARGQRLRTRNVVTVESVKLAVEITFFPAAPRVGDEIQFLARVSGDALQFTWFIDGKIRSQSKDFSSRFDAVKTYEVRLAARNNAGVLVEATRQITIAARQLQVDFSAPFEVLDGEVVQFANETAGERLAFDWNLGDGQTSRDRNPRHVFHLKGGTPESFSIKVSATDETGLTVDSPVRHIRVLPPKKELSPLAGFRVEGSGWKVGTPVQLIDDSKRLVADYWYEFGTEGTSTNKNPSFTFSASGEKLIRQRVRGPGGESWATNRVTITPQFKAPRIVNASVSPTQGRAPVETKCDAQISGDYNRIQWLLGTNMLSTKSSFVTTLTQPVQTEIRLIVVPSEPGTANIEKAFPVSILAPLAPWLKWSPAALLVMIGGVVAFCRFWPKTLLGEIEWQYSGHKGQAKLDGSSLKLSELQIPGWQPTRSYVLRNKNCHQISSEAGLEMELSHKKTFRLDGVTFTYLNEAETL